VDRFLLLPVERRRVLCEEAGNILGLSAGSVEKDFWVCWTLRTLFDLPVSGPHLTFKGGTSLSKGWKLIQRFSEDIDIVIDRDYLGFGGERSPESASSNKQRAKRIEQLKDACQRHIRDVLLPAFRDRVRELLPGANLLRIENDPDDEDDQTILFHYQAATAEGTYVRPIVKIELGARSDIDPSTTPEITPYLADVFRDEIGVCAFSIRTLAPERTFWEKVALLHEESYRATHDGPKARLARHYYDLWCLLLAGVGDRARADEGLFERVTAHRAVFFRKSKEAQDSLRRGSLRLVPAADRRAAWRRDYEAMREAMFFGDPPSFDTILAVIADFEQQFNAIGEA
jgi:hypothetical protein